VKGVRHNMAKKEKGCAKKEKKEKKNKGKRCGKK